LHIIPIIVIFATRLLRSAIGGAYTFRTNYQIESEWKSAWKGQLIKESIEIWNVIFKTSSDNSRIGHQSTTRPTMYTGNNDSGNLNSRYQSYQQGGSSYIPPGRTYAEQQTNVVQDAVKTQYQAEATANTVLTQMHTQRHQLQGAHDDVWKMREATEKAKREIEDLAAKRRQQRFRLYGIIAILGTVDLVLFLRIIKCGGSFFC